jgi:RNA polymerase sigma-70 factor (ECF subfamily)
MANTDIAAIGDPSRARHAALPAEARAPETSERAPTPCIRALVDEHHAFIWRTLRRMGVPAGQVDDAAQEVFCVLHRRLFDIRAGRERPFLFAVALNVAADARRKMARSREQIDSAAVDAAVSATPTPEQALDRRQARAQLDEVLDFLGDDARAVFVLVELEGMTAREIASILEIPLGTVASRLRRGRDQFRLGATHLRARAKRVGGDHER